jgi:Secretion system C-terminal sorting domain
VNSSREIFTYNANDSILSRTNENWSNNAWVSSSRDEYVYYATGNNAGKMQSRIVKKYDATLKQLVNYQSWYFTFTDEGLIKEEIMQYWSPSNSTWSNSLKLIFSFTPFGRIETLITQEWDFNAKLWVNYYKYFYDYDNLNRPTRYTLMSWNKLNQAYTDSLSKRVFHYNSNGYTSRQLTYFVNSNTLVLDLKSDNKYWYKPSATLSVVTNHSKADVVLYPNPCANKLLKVNVSKNCSYQLRDMNGKMLNVGFLQMGENALDLRNYISGLYILTAENESHRIILE